MSKRRQQAAKDRAERARARELATSRRAQLSRERGHGDLARIHESSARAHATAAEKAEEVLVADRHVEGDRLSDSR